MPKISVIIPVYNVDKYLNRCIDSVINQTLKEIEIIILNDGSTDNSENIIKSYQKKDSRIIYIKQENIGLGPTRNKGVEIAKGEYLSFIDSDDFIAKNMLELMYNNAIKNNSDIVCGQVCMYYDNGKLQLRTSLSNIETYHLKNQDKRNFYKNYYFKNLFSHNAWDKIYRTELIKKNDILFGDNKQIFSEDNYFQLQVLNKANIISFIDEDIYYYYVRPGSIMNSYKKNLVDRHMNMIADLDNSPNIDNTALQKEVISLISFEVIIMSILNIIDSNKNFKTFYKDIVKLGNNDIFIKNMNFIRKNRSYKLQPNLNKQLFIRVISLLIEKKFIFIASLMVYVKYKYMR